MIAKIAVSAARFSIDKPYSYRFGEDMCLVPGIRVMVPFGSGNRRTEGVVLSVEPGDESGLKSVLQKLDEEPLLSPTMLRLAAFLRERYFCTFFDAVRVMLPAGLWFQSKDTYALTDDRSWQEKSIRQADAIAILQLLADCGGSCTGKLLRETVSEEEAFEKAISNIYSDEWWIKGDRTLGIQVEYEGEIWQFVESGELVYPLGRVKAEDAADLYALCMEAARAAGWKDAVKPEQTEEN